LHSYHLNATNEADVLARTELRQPGDWRAIVGKEHHDRLPSFTRKESAFRAGPDLNF
jgi:hypothetical protein